MTAVERYLDALQRHDWEVLAGALRDDVERVGPFGDTYLGRDVYVAFLRDLVPTLVDYSMDVHRVVEAGDVVTVELTESMAWDGTRVITPEALVFDLDGDGRIARIRIYIQRSPGTE